MVSQNPFKIESESKMTGGLEGKFRTSWVENSFDIENDGKNRLSTPHTKNYIGTSIGSKNVSIFFTLVILVISVIFVRVFQLQILKGEEYRALAEGNRIRRIPIPAQRGMVYDRFGKEILRNIPGFSLAIVPQDLPRNQEERSRIIGHLSSISGVSIEEITSLLAKYGSYSYQSLTLKNDLDYETALKLYIENANLPGIEVESGSKRGYYVNTSTTSTEPAQLLSLSHIIGYVGKLTDEEAEQMKDLGYLPTDLIGKAGLEKIYESDLRGTFGRKKIEVNAIGKEQNVLAMEAPIPGKNLILSLDLDAQITLENIVKESAEKIKNNKIAAIAIDSNNGGILALVSWPAFDNNRFISGIDNKTYNDYLNDPDKPLFNRAIAGLYPPGSTVKLIISAAALQEKVASKFTSVLSVGGITVGGKVFKDWKAGGHGITNATKAIAWSVNTYYYYIGGGYDKFVGLGIDRIYKYLTSFGLGQKTNIDLTGEKTGFVPNKEWKRENKNESWYVGDTYNISIGQGDLLVTPLQVALWTSIVANDGNIITPHLGEKIEDPVTKEEVNIEHKITKNELVSSQNLQIVRDGMRECVVYGSCKMLSSLSFSAAGKTGTAQWSKSHPTHAWFTSFAPYQKPKIVVTVLVESGGEGASIAQPIAHKFLQWWGKKYLP